MMSSAPERPEAEFRLPEAAPPRVSESRQEAAVTEGLGWTYPSVRRARLRDVASQHQFEESESEEEGEEEEEEELEAEEARGVFTRYKLFGPQVICTSRCVHTSLSDGEPRFRWGWRPAGGGSGAAGRRSALGEPPTRGSPLSVKRGGQWHSSCCEDDKIQRVKIPNTHSKTLPSHGTKYMLKNCVPLLYFACPLKPRDRCLCGFCF